MSLYFAFGSNMNVAFLRSWLQEQGVEPDELELRGHAILHGHRLRTNYESSRNQAGAANIVKSAHSHVEGVVYEVTPAVRNALRQKEGWPRRYRETNVAVELVSTGEIIKTFTYIVTPGCRTDQNLPVTAEYRRLILDAADERDFTEPYQLFLRQFLRAATRTNGGVGPERGVERIHGSGIKSIPRRLPPTPSSIW